MYLQNVIVKCTYKIYYHLYLFVKMILHSKNTTLKWPQCFKYYIFDMKMNEYCCEKKNKFYNL